MSRSRSTHSPSPSGQGALDNSRRAHDVRRSNDNPQDFSRREVQRGTQRNETQVEGGGRRNDGGSPASVPQGPEQEQGDARRPHKRAGR